MPPAQPHNLLAPPKRTHGCGVARVDVTIRRTASLSLPSPASPPWPRGVAALPVHKRTHALPTGTAGKGCTASHRREGNGRGRAPAFATARGPPRLPATRRETLARADVARGAGDPPWRRPTPQTKARHPSRGARKRGGTVEGGGVCVPTDDGRPPLTPAGAQPPPQRTRPGHLGSSGDACVALPPHHRYRESACTSASPRGCRPRAHRKKKEQRLPRSAAADSRRRHAGAALTADEPTANSTGDGMSSRSQPVQRHRVTRGGARGACSDHRRRHCRGGGAQTARVAGARQPCLLDHMRRFLHIIRLRGVRESTLILITFSFPWPLGQGALKV